MAHRAVGEANAALRRGNDAREEELKRIARAIHDEVGQLLVRVHWAVDDATRIAPGDVQEKLRTVIGCLEAVESRLRRMSYELRPTILDDLGLEPALRSLADGVADRARITVSVESRNSGRLPPAMETVLYRVVQESLRNVIKHAHAKRVVIRLERWRGAVSCAIRDDGIGFPVEMAESGSPPQGLGLIGIRERVAQVGGTVVIRTHPGGGAEVWVIIPMGSRRRAADPARG
jgi:two-component system sensor histidine kinase UhpB